MFRPLRTPTVLQRDAVECGAACLGIVLGHHGRYVPLGELRAACGVSRDGSKALKIVQAATAYGMEAAGYSIELDHLKKFQTPYIVHWELNHFVVVEKVGKNSVLLNDPRRGHWRATAQEFAENFTGVVLTMTPGPEFRRGGQPERMSRSIIKRLRGQGWPILLGLLAGILLVVPRVLFSAAAAVFIDRILFEGRGEWVRPVAWLMVAAVVTQFLLEFLKALAARRMQLSLAAHTAGEFVWRALRLPVPFFEHRFPAEVGQRVNLNDGVSKLLSHDLVDTGVSLVTMAIYAAVLAVISWPLALVSLFLAMVNFVALRVIFARRQEISQRLAAADEKLFGASLTGVHAIESIKSSGMEAGYFARWAGFQSKSVMARQELETATLPLETLPVLTRGLTLTAVLALGGFLIAAGDLTLGGLVAFQILLNSFLTPVTELVEMFGKLQETHADLLRLEDVMTTEPDRRAPGTASEAKAAASGDGSGNGSGSTRVPAAARAGTNGVKLRGELTVSGLSYGYSPLDPPLLRDIDFRIGPGQWLGIIGGSGSGKSTLARLLTGLYEPWTGEIRLDGKTRDEFPPGLFSAAVSYVDQEIVLYEGSVRENLTLWESAVPDEVLLQACRDAAAWDVVQAMPGGMSGMLQEGGINISGGERQRLEIARAMAADPAVLVLDEATSALDAETERRIHEGLRRRGCTCVIIAHRLSAIRQCDHILLVDDGRIVSRGTHAELWDADAAYRRFFRGGAA